MQKSSIVSILNEHVDLGYKKFNERLIPNIPKECILGVRLPIIRKIYKDIKGSVLLEDFLKEIPHRFHEENILHAFVISDMKEYSVCVEQLDVFLPYIDNWAVCDSISPKVFKKNTASLYRQICRWITRDEIYSIRFCVVTLMSFFLEEEFKREHIELLLNIKKKDYYIDMAIAWYMATALFKQYEIAIEYIEENRFGTWIHNKSIQKAIESNRIKPETKDYLRTLKRNKE